MHHLVSTPAYQRRSMSKVRGVAIALFCGSVLGCAEDGSEHDPLLAPQIDCNDSEQTGRGLDAGRSQDGSTSAQDSDAGTDAAVAPPPASDAVTIRSITSFGKCKTSWTPQTSGREAAISLKDFAVVLNEKTGLQSADCELSIEVDAPPGTAWALDRVKLNGSSTLAEGMKGSLRSSYHHTGLSTAGAATHSFSGPSQGAFSLESDFSETEESFSPCSTNRALELSLELTARNTTPRAEGKVEVTDLDGLKLAVRPCTVVAP